MFIQLTAAFQSEEQPDFESLNIKATGSDFDDCIWDSLWIDYQSIVTMNVNSEGYTNVDLLNGQRWSVKESPREINRMCNVESILEHSQKEAVKKYDGE